jgi:hypothetical protein
MTTIDIETTDREDGWSCRVIVREDSGVTEHLVRVRGEDLERFGGSGEDAATLVRRSFEFLLQREPKESILHSFDLPVIRRYFPEYEREIRAGE